MLRGLCFTDFSMLTYMYMYAYIHTDTHTHMRVRVRVDVCMCVCMSTYIIFRKHFGILDWQLVGKVAKNMIHLLRRQGQTRLLGPLV